MKAKILTLVFALLSGFGLFAQDLVLYNFHNQDLTPFLAPELPNTTQMTYHKADGTVITPQSYNYVTDSGSGWFAVPGQSPNQNKYYLEMEVGTQGIMETMTLGFRGKLNAIGLLGSWKVQANTKDDGEGGYVFEDIGSLNLFSLFWWIQPIGIFQTELPATANNRDDLKIRFEANFDFSALGSLRITGIRISYGSPKIEVYTNGNNTVTPTVPANRHIPHLSAPAQSLDTEFGTVETTASTGITHRYRVRNLNGKDGYKLRVDSIRVEGAHPYDFSVNPDQLSDIDVSSSATGNPYKTFDVTFMPTADGIRTAEIYLYSNAYGGDSHNPYIFSVVGMGASCNLEVTTHAENNFTYGVQQSLEGDYILADVIAGNSKEGEHTPLGDLTLYPDGKDLFTSLPASWYVRGPATKEVTFGPIDVSDQKDIKISFNVAVFSTNSPGGANNASHVLLSVKKADGNWSEEMRLLGSKSNHNRYNYDFNTSDGRTFNEVYDGNNSAAETANRNESGSSRYRYNRFILNTHATADIDFENFEFKISAKSNEAATLWLIDDVEILSSNSVYKTFTLAGDWFPSAPNENEKAVIEGNYVNAGHPEVCECEVMEGGSLTIPDGSSVTVRGKIINHGDGSNVVVESGGNLIQREDAENIGPITVERYVSNMQNTAPDFGYVYWSSPVEEQGLADFSPGTPATGAWGFLEYDTETDYFENVNLANEPEFLAGKGYAIRTENASFGGLGNNYNKTYQFKGVPRNGEITYPIRTKTGEDYGYNLVGNPYPSNLDADELHQLNNEEIYYWFAFWTNYEPTGTQQGENYQGNNYAILNGTGGTPPTHEGDCGNCPEPNGSIGVGQGFIVVAKEDAEEITFRNRNPVSEEMLRISDPAPFFQKGEKDRFWLTLTSPGGIVNTALIGYIPGATDGFDGDFDAEFWGADDAIYSTLEGAPLIIQGKEYPLDPEDIVPLGNRFSTEGVYEIALKDPEGSFTKDVKVWIRDKELDLEHNLSKEAYKFYTGAGSFEDRFEIFYKEVSFGTSAESAGVFTQAGDILVTREGQNIVILSTKNNIFAVEVFNIVGWPVYGAEDIHAKEHRIPAAQLSNNILFVRVKDENGKISTHKLIAK